VMGDPGDQQHEADRQLIQQQAGRDMEPARHDPGAQDGDLEPCRVPELLLWPLSCSFWIRR
jgi:hypothetical protein